MKDNSPIFIAGAGRSGTTLFADMLGLYPRLSPVYETDFVMQLVDLLFTGKNLPPSQAAALALQIMDKWTAPLPLRPHFKREHERYDHGPHHILFDRAFAMARTKEFVQAVQSGRAFDGLRALMTSLFSEHCRLDNKPRWVNKTPAYIHCLPLLLRMFPTMRLIHCLRDGRDVACSVVTRPWGPKTYAEAAKWWTKSVQAALNFQNEHPDRCITVRYEDLLRKPEDTLGRMLSWLGEDGDSSQILQSYRTNGIRLDPSRIGGWVKSFSPEDANTFQQTAGELLTRFGYSGTPPDDALSAEVRQFILSEAAPPWWKDKLTDSVPVGAGGLGLDSIATVELLLACEKRWNTPFPAELLEHGPLTVGMLVQHLRQSKHDSRANKPKAGQKHGT